MSSDPIDLDAIEARADAATPGPWDPLFGTTGPGTWWIGYDDNGVYEGVPQWNAICTDVSFITHAREDVPALVAEVRRLRAEVSLLDPHAPIPDGVDLYIQGFGPVPPIAGA